MDNKVKVGAIAAVIVVALGLLFVGLKSSFSGPAAAPPEAGAAMREAMEKAARERENKGGEQAEAMKKGAAEREKKGGGGDKTPESPK